MKGEIKITNFEYCKQIARVAHFGQFRKFTTVERIRRKIQAEGRYPQLIQELLSRGQTGRKQ